MTSENVHRKEEALCYDLQAVVPTIGFCRDRGKASSSAQPVTLGYPQVRKQYSIIAGFTGIKKSDFVC